MEIPFKHDPLEHPWQIRVLDMLPGEGSNPIHCKVRLIPGGDARDIDPNYDEAEDKKKIPYHALSYTWGKAIESHTIWLEDKPFPIRANLYEFMKQWRPKENSSFLWTDAICIDQTSDTERGDQVARMTSIYKHAETVVIWLGPASDDSNLAISELIRIPTEAWAKAKAGEDWPALLQRLFIDEGWTPLPSDNEKVNNRALLAIRELFSRPWWTRVWTVQESTVPNQQNWVLCGDRSISWGILQEASFILRRFALCKPEFQYVEYISRSESTVLAIQQSRQAGGIHMSLMRLLPVFRSFEATDDRDRVYALLGMAEDVDHSTFPKPSYQKTVEEVYRDVAQYFITTSPFYCSLDIFGHADNFGIRASPGEYPADFRNILKSWDGAVATLKDENFIDCFEITNRMFKQFESLVLDTLGTTSDTSLAFVSALRYGGNFLNRLGVSNSTPIHEQEITISDEEVMNVLQVLISLLRCLPNVSEDCDGGIFSNSVNTLENFVSKIGPSESNSGEMQDLFVALESVFKANAKWDTFQVTPFANAGRGSIAYENGRKIALDIGKVLTIEETEMFDSALLKVNDDSAVVWPSWIPDWRRRELRTNIFPRTMESKFSNTCPATHAYAASGHDPKVFTSLIGIVDLVSIEGYELQLYGFQVDIIKNLSGLNLENYNPNSNLTLLLDSQHILPFDMEDLYATGETVSDAFLRTINADIVRDGSQALYRLKDSAAELRDPPSGTSTDPSYICKGRQFSVTFSNSIGLVPKLAEIGDEIYLLAGGKFLYVLRPRGDCYRLIGECYIHGLMDGEALEMLQSRKKQLRQIRIV
jgi:hypothetical protein